MALKVLCLGTTEKGLYTQLLDEYLKRLSKYTSVTWDELPQIKQKKANSRAQDLEADQILKRIKSGDFLCLLDENGKEFSSRKFSKWISDTERQLSGDLVFVIGSAYGFSEQLKSRANFSISLSKLTFNHQMVRGILAEQLYRAYNIMNGGNYHND